MEGKVSVTTLVVKDLAKALAFYTEKAGFEKKTDFTSPQGYRWVTVGLKGQDLELALYQVGLSSDPLHQEWGKQWAPGRAPPVIIMVTDCRKTYEELHGRGVSFPQPPTDHPWGTVATFADPDGNLFSISQQRGWSQTK
jgi:predicted enzyme related to lactoylglutathione lyase